MDAEKRQRIMLDLEYFPSDDCCQACLPSRQFGTSANAESTGARRLASAGCVGAPRGPVALENRVGRGGRPPSPQPATRRPRRHRLTARRACGRHCARRPCIATRSAHMQVALALGPTHLQQTTVR